MVDGGGGGGGGGSVGGYGGAAPVVNINLDEVKNAINAVKSDTNEIKEALSEQGRDIKDIKVTFDYEIYSNRFALDYSRKWSSRDHNWSGSYERNLGRYPEQGSQVL